MCSTESVTVKCILFEMIIYCRVKTGFKFDFQTKMNRVKVLSLWNFLEHNSEMSGMTLGMWSHCELKGSRSTLLQVLLVIGLSTKGSFQDVCKELIGTDLSSSIKTIAQKRITRRHLLEDQFEI